MEQEKITEKLIQYIDGKLSVEETEQMKTSIDQDIEIKKMYGQLKEIDTAIRESEIKIPSDQMTHRYQTWLQSQELNSTKNKTIQFNTWKIAASIAFLLSVGIAAWTITSNNKQQQALLALQEELDATKKVFMTNIHHPLSASTRLQALHTSLDFKEPDDEIISVLAQTLNEDPNTNVRLAALEALQKFNQLPQVKTILISSLKNQKDATVQIALIQLLVQMKEKTIIQDLQKLTEQPGTFKAVKDEAYQGIFKLT